MAQHDYVISNASGATVRADINSALSAIQTLNSGTSAPSSTAAGMLWLDTTGGAPYALKVRDAGNNHWLTLASVTDPGSDGNIETSATIKGTIDSSADLTNANFPAGTTTSGQVGGGHILQVQSVSKKDTFSVGVTTAGEEEEITGLAVKITPQSTSNKIAIFYTVHGGSSVNSRQASFGIILKRDTTTIGNPTSPGSRPATNSALDVLSTDNDVQIGHVSNNFIDEPSSTSELTYKLFIVNIANSTSLTYFVNRTELDTDTAFRNRTISTITAMEIKG